MRDMLPTLLRNRMLHWMFAAALLLVPSAAFAAGSEANVVLNFSDSDKMFLYVSLGLGIVALLFGWWLASWVKKQSPGPQEMQEVGGAIREGALAYLGRQIKTMIIFVVLLALGLFFMSWKVNEYSLNTAIYVALSFVGGVAASYIAGYAGMKMAVEGNMRTANAALTSYGNSLRVAFRSGAVAGMVTVGMGLIGATLIFLFAGSDAMKLLVGFGFGGSLAALFMRVGGGIFTKAADVGADLVGKVEAGIPEDDPRNPATIADNVGDNVGDCAGMAADVFESYEVTLVAAIVLGAATASIFDQSTWMKLILFALMARGVGIVASIIGILSVRGSDDIDSDPLKAITGGFWTSAAIATVGTLALAYFMMGGQGAPIKTTRLLNIDALAREERDFIVSERDRLAQEQNKPKWQISAADVQKASSMERLKLNEPSNLSIISNALIDADRAQSTIPQPLQREIESLADFRPVNVANPTSDLEKRVANYTVNDIFAENSPTATSLPLNTLGKVYGGKNLQIYHVQITRTPKTTEPGQQATPQTEAVWAGPLTDELFQRVVTEYTKQSESPESPYKLQVKAIERIPTQIYANPDGRLLISLGDKIEFPHREDAQIRVGLPYYEEDLKTVQTARDALAKDSTTPQPVTRAARIATVEHKDVPWYMFFAAIFFGIVMAFLIERLTDYYVSTHKKPVQEVAGVATAGPAPMIIAGFALAAESSVFSVFAIVVALLAPLFFFPPADYGSYILSFYGIALVGLGLLTTTGYILAMDTFGPISDNAQGVYEMSGVGHSSPNGSKAVQRLDAAGNTTKALTKGFAIATAVVAAVALFHSYVEDAHLTSLGLKLDVPEIFLGLLIGGAAPYLFSAFSINAVGRASFTLINEVRRQFRNDPGILAGTSKPNYGNCVAIVTKAAQTELLGPGILAIALPAAVAFGLSIGKDPVRIGDGFYNLTGAQALGGFLAGAILSGQLMAVLLANSGGMWDNAKKLIEDGLYGGKGTDAHKAGVVCDTVGDPFKDTAGPALNPLIKVMNLVALILAPIVILPLGNMTLAIITAACIFALAFSIWWSKRGSMSSAMEEAKHTGEAGAAAFDSGKPNAAASVPTPPVDQMKPTTPETGAAKPKKKITVDDDPAEE
jgi:K(+)-stimulated pyrophosphate-energized sodium pump